MSTKKLERYFFSCNNKSYDDDKIELLGFPVPATPFNLLKTSCRGTVMACDLIKYHKKEGQDAGLSCFPKTRAYKKRE